ncbi:MAG: FHA domain-containing protein [Chrysiogenales bacterium]|nr:MAG: FHA domain-containing protein [Chrysiogenales bacterium]
MKYLLYFQEGFIRKFPLDKKVFTIGRAAENDLVVKEDCVSRRHLQVSVGEDHIDINDLGSRNGTYVKGGRVSEARIDVNESFLLKSCEFFLKRGDLTEFKAAPELIPVFKQMGRRAAERTKDIETHYISDTALEVLKQLLADGLKCRSMSEYLLSLSNYLSIFSNFGNLVLTCRGQDGPVYSYRHAEDEAMLLEIVRQAPDAYGQIRSYEAISGRLGEHFYSFPLKLHDSDALLLYFPPPGNRRPLHKVEKFLHTLAKQIELVAQLVPENGDAAVVTDGSDGAEETINTINPEFKRLINEAKRIAASELFILIQGESGTGKELFAQLIHRHSDRRHKPLVAINCAAIPENLLESEFFGHEKGAFTGAHAQKKGKLELSSGGVLLLDEIGEMPRSLQAKLLRALEEHEFFRVGGVTPIQVDLRIVSLTNSQLQELIAAKKFRSDLYYRLVHHTITLPPLRERREDIAPLINHFTLFFSRQYGREVKGYSVNAFRALKEYPWPGNVRQLKNEVHRLVNLAGANCMIDFELISDTIRQPAADPGQTASFAAQVEPEDERALLLRLLAKNNGNKSRTARELNMTYQGLHKKMKRLGIDKQSTP